MKKPSPVLTQTDIDWLINSMEERFPTQKQFAKYTHQVLEKLDHNSGELKTIREEQTLHSHDHSRVDRRLSRLENRSKLSPLLD